MLDATLSVLLLWKLNTILIRCSRGAIFGIQKDLSNIFKFLFSGYRLDNCSPGTYQDRSARFYCYMCPGGQYCETEGLTSPTGSCSPGYYCFKGSVSPTWFECPVGHYCTASEHFLKFQKFMFVFDLLISIKCFLQ